MHSKSWMHALSSDFKWLCNSSETFKEFGTASLDVWIDYVSAFPNTFKKQIGIIAASDRGLQLAISLQSRRVHPTAAVAVDGYSVALVTNFHA